MPLTYETSWTAAAEKVLTLLLASIATAYTARFGAAPVEDRDAWLDVLPARVPCFAIFAGGGSDVAISDTTAAPATLDMDARIEGRFTRREDARAFGMMVLAGLPIYHQGNVEWFRIAQNPRIDTESIRLANDKKAKTYYKLVLPCLLVFRTAEEFT